MGRKHDKKHSDRIKYAEGAPNAEQRSSASRPEEPNEDENPPRTTTGWFTAPKFGGATSGGGEIEPVPERD